MTNPYFGTDMYLNNGDIVISNSGDVQTITDVDNVVQAIQNALFTEKGSLYYDTEYGVGLGSLIGEKNVLIKRALLRNDLINTLYNDPRIKTVDDVIVDTDSSNPMQLNVSIKATLIDDTQLIADNLIFPYFKPKAETTSITSEAQKSISQSVVYSEYQVFDLKGVYLSTDTEKTGTNYFTGGSVSKNRIVLGTKLPSTYTDVILDYETLNVTYTSKKITQIRDEKVLTSDGKTLMVNYNIYDLTSVYSEEDTEQMINYANVSTFEFNKIFVQQNISKGTYYLISYSTTDL